MQRQNRAGAVNSCSSNFPTLAWLSSFVLIINLSALSSALTPGEMELFISANYYIISQQ